MKKIFLVISIFCLVFGCSNNNETDISPTSLSPGDGSVSKEKEPDSITLENETSLNFQLKKDSISLISDSGKEYCPFLINENVVHFFIPKNENLSNLYLKNDTQFTASLSSTDFSDFCNPVTLFYQLDENNKKSYTIVLYDLPVMMIDTPDKQEIVSKEIYTEDCNIKIISESQTEELGIAKIKGRGNSTWMKAKKPYNIKFDKKKNVLGMPSSKKWVLLANAFYDRTQLHNAVAFEVARLTDYSWVQQGRFVELVLNGNHKGLYYLCEKIDVEKNKIKIDELKKTDIDENVISGGYLIESDVLYPEGTSSSEQYSFLTGVYDKSGLNGAYKCTLGWFLKNPDEDVPTEQFDYIKNHMIKLECAVLQFENSHTIVGGGYKQYLDIESLINWYLVEELCLNEEASRTKNLYLYKKRGNDKIFIGPPWDFDAWTFGLLGTKKNYLKDSGWFWNVLLSDPAFVSRLKEKWNAYKGVWEEKIPNYIDEQYKLIHNSALRNEKMWNEWDPVNEYPQKSYEQIIEEMKVSFNEQFNWMNSEINGL